MSIVEKIITYSIDNKMSDIHLTEGKVPVTRRNGELVRISATIITKEDIEGLIKKFAPDMFDKMYKQNYLDCSFEFKDTRFRANFYIEQKRIAVAIRLIPTNIPLMGSLNLPESINGILNLKDGLILVTGVTGSGKSTTIASIINEINKTRAEHIMTIEDPVEFVYKEDKSLIHQREVGTDCHSFADASACALREDPDIIVLGEIRTHESISTALALAETGHLVFATLHTKSAPESVDRIIDVFAPEQQSQVRLQLANTLRYVVSQKLVKSADGMGRVPLIELMIVNQAVSSGILTKAPTGQIKDQISLNHQKLGTQTFAQSAKILLEKGLVSIDAVRDYMDSNNLEK